MIYILRHITTDINNRSLKRIASLSVMIYLSSITIFIITIRHFFSCAIERYASVFHVLGVYIYPESLYIN